jgi:hypothetical protein
LPEKLTGPARSHDLAGPVFLVVLLSAEEPTAGSAGECPETETETEPEAKRSSVAIDVSLERIVPLNADRLGLELLHTVRRAAVANLGDYVSRAIVLEPIAGRVVLSDAPDAARVAEAISLV